MFYKTLDIETKLNDTDNRFEIRFRSNISENEVAKNVEKAKDYAKRITNASESNKVDEITLFKNYLTKICGYEVSPSKEKFGGYTLYNNKLRYEVSPEVQKVLEGAMYWSHCQKLDTQELHIAEKEGSGYTEEEIKKLRFDVEGCDVTIRDIMNKMDELNVPNWVGNGALAFGRDNDLRNHYMSEFFESGKYSEKGQKKLREIYERD